MLSLLGTKNMIPNKGQSENIGTRGVRKGDDYVFFLFADGEGRWCSFI